MSSLDTPDFAPTASVCASVSEFWPTRRRIGRRQGEIAALARMVATSGACVSEADEVRLGGSHG